MSATVVVCTHLTAGVGDLGLSDRISKDGILSRDIKSAVNRSRIVVALFVMGLQQS